MKRIYLSLVFLVAVSLHYGLTGAAAAVAAPFFFSTGNPDGRMATGSRPASAGQTAIESADDFVLTLPSSITGASFAGLLTGGATPSSIGEVIVKIYRVFPNDSTNPASGNVPTRVNSPSDVLFGSRDSTSGTLHFTASIVTPGFTAANSVLNGISKLPNQITTSGEGPVSGVEVLFNVTFNSPFFLPADHYFFVPQVQVTGGEFFWLSAPKPIAAPGTPFTPDLQSWIRNANLSPDWIRIGTDIVGGVPAPTFNAAFSLSGDSLFKLWLPVILRP